MTETPDTTINDQAADVVEAGVPVNRAPLRSRRPAELTTFLAGLLVLAAAAGLSLSEEVLYAAVAVIAGVPAAVTWLVGIARDTLRALDE